MGLSASTVINFSGRRGETLGLYGRWLLQNHLSFHVLSVNESLGVTFALEMMDNKWIDPAKEDIMDVCPAANL